MSDGGSDSNSCLGEATPLGSRRRGSLLGAWGAAPGDLEDLILGVEEVVDSTSGCETGEGDGGEASLQGRPKESPVEDQTSDKSIKGSPSKESCSDSSAASVSEVVGRSESSKVPLLRNS